MRDTLRLHGGLCSPGRWKKEVRELADGAKWYWLRREMKKAIVEFVGSEKDSTGEWLAGHLDRELFREAEEGLLVGIRYPGQSTLGTGATGGPELQLGGGACGVR